MAKIIKLILTDVKIGKGVEGDPVRLLKQLWTIDGELVAEEEDDCGSKSYPNDFSVIK